MTETSCAAGCRLRVIEGARARGAVAQEGEVHRYVDGGLCSDAGRDEIRMEAGVYARRAKEQGLFCGGPVARWGG